MPRSKDGEGEGRGIFWRKYFFARGWEVGWVVSWVWCYRQEEDGVSGGSLFFVARLQDESLHGDCVTGMLPQPLNRIIIKGLPTQCQHYFIFSIKFLIIFINSHLCHHRCHIINITRYQSTWWDFANLIVNPHLTHSLIPLQMALMSRCHLIQLQQTIHNQPMAGYFIQRDIFPPVQCIIKIVVKIHANFSKMC